MREILGNERRVGADVAQRFGVRANRVGRNLFLEQHEQPIAEPVDERFETRRVPAARHEAEPVGLGRAELAHDVDEVRVGRDPVAPHVVHHRRLRAVDRVAQDGDQANVGMHLLDALRDARRVVTPDHVARRRLTDDRLAAPAVELVAVPVEAEFLDPLALFQNDSSDRAVKMSGCFPRLIRSQRVAHFCAPMMTNVGSARRSIEAAIESVRILDRESGPAE